MERLSETQIKASLAVLPDWSETGGEISRTFQFKNFVESMRFVNAVAAAAEADQHHPDILVRWNKVRLSLSTHDAGGITEKDFAMARKTDALGSGVAGAAQATPPPGGKRAKK